MGNGTTGSGGYSVQQFSGGITNSGSISAAGGISVDGVSTFAGGIVNAAGGTITATTGAGIAVGGTHSGAYLVGSFGGGVSNAGTISAAGTGILINGVSTFNGGITNSGTIDTRHRHLGHERLDVLRRHHQLRHRSRRA